MNVSEARRKSSGELVNQVAHDAGTVRGNEHVKGSVLRESAQDVNRHRHAGDVGGIAIDSFGDSAASVGAEVLNEAGAGLGAGAFEMGGIALLGYEALCELSRAEGKADQIKNASNNDAVNIAMSSNLAFDPSFAMFEALKRPGISKNAVANLTIELHKPENAAVLTVLQARADEGFKAANRAMQATANVPPEQRSAAIAQWYKDNGFADRLKNDVAFGKGVEYHAFVQEPLSQKRGLSLEAARKEVEARAPIDRQVWVQS